MQTDETRDRQAALERLMAQYGTALLRMCCLYLRDYSLAEDAVQETFLKAYARLDSFRGDCSEQTWLMKIAINTCRDMLRSAWMRHHDRYADLSKLPERAYCPEPPDDTIVQAVSALPPRLREAVLLRYYQGMKVDDVAQALRTTRSGVKHRLKQSVDRAFAGAAWDETHARRVISKIEERKQPVMKRKLTAALVCALVLVLASACALAAVFVQRSERSNVVLTARNALTRQYRFTPGMLALFRADAQKNAGGDYTVTFTTNEGIPETLLGVYTVHVNGSTAVASWSYDGHAGDMDHWDASIMAAYLAEDASAWMMGETTAPYHEYALQTFSLSSANATPTPFTLFTQRPLKEDEVRYDGEISRIVDAGSQDIAQDRAEELGKAALLEDFGLTKEAFEAEGSGLVYATLYQRPNGQRIWDLDWYIPAYVNGIEWCCCVRLDAQTGEILDCDAVTGGIG